MIQIKKGEIYKMSKKIELIKEDIKCLERVYFGTSDQIEKMIQGIIMTYCKDIPQIEKVIKEKTIPGGPGPYDYPNTVKIYDNDCIDSMIRLLRYYIVELEEPTLKNNESMVSITTTNNNIATSSSDNNITINIDISSIMESLNKLDFKQEEIEEIEDTLELTEKAISKGDKEKAKAKIGKIMKYVDKGIDVAIALAPILYKIFTM